MKSVNSFSYIISFAYSRSLGIKLPGIARSLHNDKLSFFTRSIWLIGTREALWSKVWTIHMSEIAQGGNPNLNTQMYKVHSTVKKVKLTG